MRNKKAQEEKVVAEPTEENEGNVSFSKVEDPELLKRLNEEIERGEFVTAYRAVNTKDGEWYSPMAGGGLQKGAKKNGYVGMYQPKKGEFEQADEHPELIQGYAKEGHGMITILKDDGKGAVKVAYNPYLHASRQMLNDQFTSAWKRPGLATMAVMIPKSELSSGYRAEGAKNSVGETSWHSGPLSSRLPEGQERKVILSRYDKPMGVVGMKEWGNSVQKQLKAAGINDVPWNCFTPEQRDELVNRGFEVTKPKGDIGADGMAIYEGWNRAYEEWRDGDRNEPFVSPKFDYRELPTVKNGKRSDLPEELFSHYGERAVDDGEVLRDNQGNPINADGSLLVKKVHRLSEITDDDFYGKGGLGRNIELPQLPERIGNLIGAGGKPAVIKANIFERNRVRHPDLTPKQSRTILQDALYNPDLYGQNQKIRRPHNWVVINTKGEEGENKTALLEVNPNKDNVEIVHWHYLDDRGVEKIKRQAVREDGQLLILPSELSEEAGALSSPTYDLRLTKFGNIPESTKSSDVNSKDVDFSKKSLDDEREKIINESKRSGTYLKAPNGKETNLDEERWGNVRTGIFKKWFGDWENDPDNASKVVDENGEPLVIDGLFLNLKSSPIPKMAKDLSRAMQLVETCEKAEKTTKTRYNTMEFAYTDEGEAFYDKYVGSSDSIQTLFDQMITGYEPKVVVAFRYGEVPVTQHSRNYRDNVCEAGVSVVGRVLDMGTKRSRYYEAFWRGEDYNIVIGYNIGKRGSDGEMLLTDAKVIGRAEELDKIAKPANFSGFETTKGEVDFSVKSSGVERKYQNGVPLKLEGETIPDYVGVLSRSLSRNMGNDAAKETLAKELQKAADKYTTNALRSSELRRLAGDILVTR